MLHLPRRSKSFSIKDAFQTHAYSRARRHLPCRASCWISSSRWNLTDFLVVCEGSFLIDLGYWVQMTNYLFPRNRNLGVFSRFFICSFYRFRVICSLWWSTWMEVISCFIYRKLEDFRNQERDFMELKLFLAWNFCITRESFIGLYYRFLFGIFFFLFFTKTRIIPRK